MNRLLQTAPVVACLALVLGSCVPAAAQSTHSLRIQDGKVWIDDQPVGADALPASLNVRDVSATFSFYGDATPMLEMNGILYVLEARRLREVADLREENGRTNVYYRGTITAPIGLDEHAFQVRYEPAENVAAFTLMQQHADALERYHQELEVLRQSEPVLALEQASDRVAEAAEVAQSLPRLQVYQYYSDVQRQNEDLYNQLVKESQMEADAQALARTIRVMPESAERDRRIEELRGTLDVMFEMKQDNRRREIQQLETDLDDLRERLLRREVLRERIIQQRLEELIGVRPSTGND